jgi:hypothetical protein
MMTVNTERTKVLQMTILSMMRAMRVVFRGFLWQENASAAKRSRCCTFGPLPAYSPVRARSSSTVWTMAQAEVRSAGWGKTRNECPP